MTKTPLSKGKLLSLVNSDLEKEPWYLKGLKVVDARMQQGSLVMTINLDNLPPTLARSFNAFVSRYTGKYELK